ncbi:2-dehydro-3-deoxygalactonokinase [Devosia sp.]|uniref:2-dehydro-3-deoxygalactonokinase n=1 Tax=Devosia sp. TaxID=1871048 RepID=UPI0025FA61E7|nr:2-dehydro-3-deoxygalactonokinase [Devosia sp.]MCR6634852.1 2-dehydro-3-deoxygalactonokinase [Devosia sp.]
MSESVAWIAVDWGTSNLRGWTIDAGGNVLASRSSPKGMGKLIREEFPAALAELLSGVDLTTPTDVLVCGMAGARQGWLEAPYLEAPTDLRDLLGGAVRPDSGSDKLKVSILPGVCQKQGADNVMRGEETQLLGLASTLPGYSGLVCMPGTHSKWALLDGTKIEHFTTAMTGEMFEILSTHSVLRHSLGGDLDTPERAEGFRGRRRGRSRAPCRPPRPIVPRPRQCPCLGPPACLVRRLSIGPAHRHRNISQSPPDR